MPGRKPGLRRRLLILGGTQEAAKLAGRAVEKFGPRLEVVTSLAGRTSNPAPIPGRVRSGGFGGPEGLADYLERNAVDFVIDATHP
ncbi:MAG: precorrin-6A/cobalt-precorrin-6A reductase, partial [Alphaproteobacteria bacterium]